MFLAAHTYFSQFMTTSVHGVVSAPTEQLIQLRGWVMNIMKR